MAALAVRVGLPAIYGFREFAEAGGLMSYGANLPAVYWRAARLVDKILKGASPADLPIEVLTRFELRAGKPRRVVTSGALRRRRPSLVVAVALANKTARIAWAVMHRQENYQRMATAA